MASQIKHKIAKNFYEALQSKTNFGCFNDILMRFKLLRKKTDQAIWCVDLPAQSDITLDTQFFQKSQEELLEKKIVKNVTLSSDFKNLFLKVEVDLKKFIKDVIDSDPTKFHFQTNPKKIIVEFSSPNIAKPFHMGHLRSTIIGNCIANLKKKFGNDVVKLNYLGDWGTQFGLIKLGMNMINYSEEDLKKNPLEVMLKAYVKGNLEAEKNLTLFEEAKQIFNDLENGKKDITQFWKNCRNWTIEELNSMYKRLAVSFDEYAWESDYNKSKAENILNILQEQGLLSEDRLNRKVAVIGQKVIPLLKSDGSTLYMLRDLLAVMERRSKYKFDEMYYVVDNGQSDHFMTLMELCHRLKIDEGIQLHHVKFGRVHGMSTRKGKVVFLSEVLDEARERVYEIQKMAKNTKVSLDNKDVADILGVSAVIVNDLRKLRLKDYEYDLESGLQLKGATGPSLQYCHSRLCNLEIESGCSPATDCDPEALLDPSAVNLVQAIAKYEEALYNAETKLEPCYVLLYLFDLVKAINSAYKNLTVKGGDAHISSQRLLMFNKSREVLNEGLRLLGITPLKKM